METNNLTTVGSFVAKDYRTAAVFQRYGIDFCCKGGRSLSEVCDKNNIAQDRLLSELEKASAEPGNSVNDFQNWDLDLLADYIEKKHHRYVVQITPVIQAYLDKICQVHGTNHPELKEIRGLFNGSANDLATHMQKEEIILFPFIRKMTESFNTTKSLSPSIFGTVRNPIGMMMEEHDAEGERFRKIAALSNNYEVPQDGCTTYRVALSTLKAFEEDLHLHIHLENNILFPKAIEMEKQFANAV